MKYTSCLLIAALILFSSCKQTNKDSVVLTVGVMSSMDFVPLAIAREKGIFDKHNVKVDIQKFYAANDRDIAFQSGNIDGTVIDYTGAILQKAGGVDLKITSACNAPFCIMTGPAGNITKIEDLKGKKIAVSRHTVIDFCIEMALKSAGVAVDEVEKQEVNKIPNRLEMMMNGQTDATALPDPFLTIAASKGARSIVCMDDLGYATTGFIFKSNVIKEKETQLKAFYQAYNEAVAYIHSHSIEDIRSILINDVGFPEAMVALVKLPAYTPASMPSDKDIQATVDWLEGKGLIPAGFSTEDLLYNHFIAQ